VADHADGTDEAVFMRRDVELARSAPPPARASRRPGSTLTSFIRPRSIFLVELAQRELGLRRRFDVNHPIHVVGVKGRDADLLGSLLRDPSVLGLAELLHGRVGDSMPIPPGISTGRPFTKTSRWACTW
jgi:hypothetical protein